MKRSKSSEKKLNKRENSFEFTASQSDSLIDDGAKVYNMAVTPFQQNEINSQKENDVALPLSEPKTWTLKEVTMWLRYEGFEEYGPLFEKQKIDGQVLLSLNERDLRDPPLHLTVLGDIKRMNLAIQKLRKTHNIVDDKADFVSAEELSAQQRPESPATAHLDKRPRTIGSSAFPFSFPHVPASLLDSSEWTVGDKGALPKLLFSIAYLMCVCFVTAFTMTICHDRVPDQSVYPPLPDIFLDLIAPIPWAFEVTELIILFFSVILATVLLFHKHRFVIMKRFCAIAGTIFLCRCVTMFVTSLSVPGSHLKCDVKVAASLEEKLRYSWMLMKNLGMSINGVRTCGDYMFSGHTSMVTLLNYFVSEYTPHNWLGFHSFTYALNIIAMLCILAAHEHYSLDVLVAFFISSRLFLYYHSLANAIALRGMDRERIKSFFPMFSYLEEHTDGMVPNDYEMPWTPILRNLTLLKKLTQRKLYQLLKRTQDQEQPINSSVNGSQSITSPASPTLSAKKRRRKKAE